MQTLPLSVDLISGFYRYGSDFNSGDSSINTEINPEHYIALSVHTLQSDLSRISSFYSTLSISFPPTLMRSNVVTLGSTVSNLNKQMIYGFLVFSPFSRPS